MQTPHPISRGTVALGGVAATTTVVLLTRHQLGEISNRLLYRSTALTIVVVMGLAAVAYGLRYRAQESGVAAVENEYAAALENTSVGDAARLLHPAIKEPWRLAFVADGRQASTPDVYHHAVTAWAQSWVQPKLTTSQQANRRLHPTPQIDWTFILGAVLSFAVFALCYDSVCGRYSNLKLLLTYPVARWQVMTANLLAVEAALAVPLAAGGTLACALFAHTAGTGFERSEITKIGLVLCLGLLAIACYVLMALIVSALAREPATSLVVLSLLWVTAVVVVPEVSTAVAKKLHPMMTPKQVDAKRTEIEDEIERTFKGGDRRARLREWELDDYVWERQTAAAQTFRYDQEDALRRMQIGTKLAQVELAQTLAMASPTSLVGRVAEQLVGTGLERERDFFFDQAGEFVASLRDHFTRLDAQDPESPGILFLHNFMSQRPHDPSAFPRFTLRSRSLGDGLERARTGLALLLAEIGLLAAAALLALRLHPRG